MVGIRVLVGLLGSQNENGGMFIQGAHAENMVEYSKGCTKYVSDGVRRY